MRSAVIVSTARTPIGRAYRGAFNALPSPTLAARSIEAAVQRAGIDGAEVQDVVFGAALQQGYQATNIARSEEHTSELQSLMRISYAVFCLKKKNQIRNDKNTHKRQTKQKTKHETNTPLAIKRH